MDRDEAAIRSLVSTRMESTAVGDLPRVLELRKTAGRWLMYRDANMIGASS